MPEIIDTNNAVNKQFQLHTAALKEVWKKFIEIKRLDRLEKKMDLSDDMGAFLYAVSKNPSAYIVISPGEDKEKASILEGKMQRLGINYYKDNTEEEIKGSRDNDYIIKREDLSLIQKSLSRDYDLTIKDDGKNKSGLRNRTVKTTEHESSYEVTDTRAESGRTESLNIAKTGEKDSPVKNEGMLDALRNAKNKDDYNEH